MISHVACGQSSDPSGEQPFAENFERGFAHGCGDGQQGWSGDFEIIDHPIPSFGLYTARAVNDGTAEPREVMRSPTFPALIEYLQAEVVITDASGGFELEAFNTHSDRSNTRIRFDANGTILVEQAIACTAPVFLPTLGTWSPHELMKITIVVFADGTLQVFKESDLIFTGIDMASPCNPSPAGMDQFRVLSVSVSAESEIVVDHVGASCFVPLPCPCYADVAPPGGDGIVDDTDLNFVMTHTLLETTGPPHPRADCTPLPAGDCKVNVDDLLAVINHWGVCFDTCKSVCFADLNADSFVNVDDLLIVINAWGECSTQCPNTCRGDIVVDQTVNVDDLLAVINAWGECPK